MERAVIAVALVAVAVVVAVWCCSAAGPTHPPSRPTPCRPRSTGTTSPSPDVPWLVAVFSSATCDSCAGVLAKAEPLQSDAVVVADVEVGAQGDIHRRYGIDAVPTTIVADADGVVQASFVGPVTATDLWAAVAEAREPGSTPDACDHGQPGPPD